MTENFIRDFIELFQGTEVPPIYRMWTALSGVSAVLGRRVKLQVGQLTYYPNVMVVLVGASGIKKSTPINQLRKRIFSLPTDFRPNVVATSLTPAALVEALIRRTNQHSLFSETCEGFALISELGNFFSKGSYEGGLPSLVIDLYDCESYMKETRSHGIEAVPDPCFGLLGGTTPDWIRESIPQGAVGGGLTSRFIFVYVEDRPNPVADPPWTPSHQAALERIDRQLARMAVLCGDVTLSPEAYIMYVNEYNAWHQSEFFQSPSLSGYANRRNGHILKVAMLFAIAGGSMVITEGHYDGARQVIRMSESTMPQVISRITSSAEGSNQEWILSMIRCEKRVARTPLLAKIVHKINSRELTEIIENLRLAGLVDCKGDGVEVFYTLK